MIQENASNFNLKNEKISKFSKTFTSIHDVMACANMTVEILFTIVKRTVVAFNIYQGRWKDFSFFESGELVTNSRSICL